MKRPPCPKCAGFLSHEPRIDPKEKIKSLSCMNCGHLIEREPTARRWPIGDESLISRGPRSGVITLDVEAKICNLRRYQGMKIKDIAAEVGFAECTISKVLSDNGMPARQNPVRPMTRFGRAIQKLREMNDEYDRRHARS